MNRLAAEKSPYLQQHAHNPVDWYAWGEEALRTAREKDRPIFLSIGYSTCHWCHVMERECFEDPAVAALMNEAFICVKVDREERPDLDGAYMAVCQALTGGGGWPLTIVMTPERRPFFAGTYIPRESAYGRLGMMELVPRIREVWSTRRSEIESSSREIARSFQETEPAAGGLQSATADLLAAAARGILGSFDAENGGFGGAPKFPMPDLVYFLLRAWRRTHDRRLLEAVEKTLSAMNDGGIHDQLGGGFHRYSTDARWFVPHFEKMLYDQALLALAYTEAFQATGRESFRRTAKETLSYVLRDMSSPEGGFYSAEDADSEGEEGKFYLWTRAEILSVLGEAQGEAFCSAFGVRAPGNFREPGSRASGRNILHRVIPEAAGEETARVALLKVRLARMRPFRDDKVLTGWNGLMIAALARAGAAFDEPVFTQAAGRTADFLLSRLRRLDGRLLHRYRGGESAIDAFADDYAYLALGLEELYEASFDPRRLSAARELLDILIDYYWEPSAANPGGPAGGSRGSFRLTAEDAPDAPIFPQFPLADGVLPSANSAALLALLKLERITGISRYRETAEALIASYPAALVDNALSFGFFLSALDFHVGPTAEVVIASDLPAGDAEEMVRAIRRSFTPGKIVLFKPGGPGAEAIAAIAPFTRFQVSLDRKPTVYVCRNQECRLPTHDLAVVMRALEDES